MILSMRSLVATGAAVGAWTMTMTSVAQADEEIVTWTERAHHVSPSAAATVGHVQVCDGRLVTCSEPRALVVAAVRGAR